MTARVVIIPSWFPNSQQTVFGSFVQDQVRALASIYDATEWHVVANDGPLDWLSLRTPVRAAQSCLRSWREAGATSIEEERPNLFVHRIRPVHGSAALGLRGYRPFKHIVARALQRIERSFGKIDLLHVHGCLPGGLVVAALRPAQPWVLTEHQSPFPFAELREVDGSLLPDLRAVFQAADAVVSVSHAHARDIEHFTLVKPTIIPNVCDESAFMPRAVRIDGEFTFLTVAGLNEQKGIDVLLRAIAVLRTRGIRARFRIVGTGPLEGHLHELAHELDVSDLIEWSGTVSRSDLPHVFRSADAFVLPSRHESFGVVFIEALATGLPIIATRCGGPEDIVRPGNGVLVPVDDHEALANAMEGMRDTHYNLVNIREDFLQRFSREAVCTRIMSLYHSVS